jgi:hypothetical protein
MSIAQRLQLLTAVYLFPPFATSLFICLSLPGVNASGYTKRITLSSYAFLGYALGNISSVACGSFCAHC